MLTYDFAVIGAGVFGSWTAHYLRQSGARVTLLDAYGAANARATSTGETRIIRMGYGPDELYTKWAARSLPLWQEFFKRSGINLFHKTQVLWVSHQDDPYIDQLLNVLAKYKVAAEKLSSAEIQKRYPQLWFGADMAAVLEPQSGILMARQSVQLLVKELVKNGVDYSIAAVAPPRSKTQLQKIETSAGPISAGTFVFACGPWLPKVFPDVLSERIRTTRQEVFFLGVPAGDDRFRIPNMPAWLHHNHPERPYALPDVENRGFKLAFDEHGPAMDPDTTVRVVSQESVEHVRAFLKDHVPALADAPILETRVCQYENTWNGDFLIDRHPEFENIWMVGGGSGHGFKHGPAVGEYVSARILHDVPAEPRFSLANKQTLQMRSVF
jgi:monomeric sarcosine oxidase